MVSLYFGQFPNKTMNFMKTSVGVNLVAPTSAAYFPFYVQSLKKTYLPLLLEQLRSGSWLESILMLMFPKVILTEGKKKQQSHLQLF